jgi:hypothetical protein
LIVTDKRLIACLAVALLLRLAFVFVGFPALEQRWHLREDGDGYGQIAQTIREGPYDDVTRGPIYPSFVALAGTPLAVKILQALLDTATVLLVWQLAGKRLWAAWLWALYPFAIWRVAFVNKEVVLTFLLAASVYVLLGAKKPWQWIVTGVLLGVVNLCKPLFLLWPVVLVAFAPRRAWLMLAAMVVVIAPWTYRNWRVTGGEFLPVATEAGGVTTFIGNYPPTLGLWEGPGKLRWMAAVEAVRQQNAGATVVQLDRAFYREAVKTWREPATALSLLARKCWRFWFLSAAQREQVISFLIQAGYMALLCIGLWRRRPWSREVGVMVALIGYVILVHALSYADLRFSLPVMPYVCALGAAALTKR